MKALSLLQPYGSLMFVPDGKRFETQSWRTNHRGLLAIHASKKLDKWHGGFARKHHATLWPNDEERVIPTGAIIGLVKIVEVYTTDDALNAGMISDTEKLFGDYGPGRFAWRTSDSIKLPFPIPCDGMLSLWEVPVEVVRQIDEQVTNVWLEEKRNAMSPEEFYNLHMNVPVEKTEGVWPQT